MDKGEKSDHPVETFSESDGEASTNILDDWDSDDGICSSRSPAKTCKRIAKLMLFLFCFFTFLILFCVGVMILFNDIFNSERHEEETTTQVEVTEANTVTTWPDPIIYNPPIPELIFEPRISTNSTLIRCTYENSGTRPYVKRMHSVIKSINSMSSNSQECNKSVTHNPEKPCNFRMSQLGNACAKKRRYGFDDCRVCVALKLNRTFGWQPIPYDDGSVPDEIQEFYHGDSVVVTCLGIGPADDKNMGPITYYPAEGFHFRYFPFLHQEGYNTPLVMVHFKKPTRFVSIHVECKAWAKNIDHSKREGITKFELSLN